MRRASTLLTKIAVIGLFVLAHTLPAALAQRTPQVVSEAAAVALAETFVRENGYTDAPESAVKALLDSESIERSNARADLLKARRNTLKPHAIGMKPVGDGWGVAFDYVDHPDTCRVVTMAADGTRLHMQHQDGIRGYWLGFSQR